MNTRELRNKYHEEYRKFWLLEFSSVCAKMRDAEIRHVVDGHSSFIHNEPEEKMIARLKLSPEHCKYRNSKIASNKAYDILHKPLDNSYEKFTLDVETTEAIIADAEAEDSLLNAIRGYFGRKLIFN